MIKMMALLPIATTILLASCASKQRSNNFEVASNSYNPSVSEQAEYYRVQEQLIEKDLPNCSGCIHGSAHEQTFTAPLNIYEIDEAAVEKFGLHNTKFDIPVTWNKQVAMWVKYFTGRGRQHFINYTQRAGRYAPVLSKIMADNGLPRDLIYLAMAESGFQNHARSWAKAVGPWQFMPYTGKKFGLEIDWYVDERRDPLKATIAAANYLKTLHNLFGSWELATAGYNAGEGKIGRAIRMYKTKDFWKISRGRYLKPETKNYVPKIMALAIIGKNLDVFGFNAIKFEKALDYEEIMVKGNADLYEVAEALELDFDDLKRYNPEIVRWQVPPTVKSYALRVPVGVKAIWDEFQDKDSVVANSYKTYSTRGTAKLVHVSRKFKVPVEILRNLNPHLKGKTIRPKTAVVLPFREDHSLKANMYADLYEKSPKRVRRKRTYNRVIASNINRGKLIKKPTVFYTVKKGDTLWRVAQRTGVPMSTIIRTNSHIVKKRMILPGDKLAIR
jgi:membrane-bound lytic murein transglycosylase D